MVSFRNKYMKQRKNCLHGYEGRLYLSILSFQRKNILSFPLNRTVTKDNVFRITIPGPKILWWTFIPSRNVAGSPSSNPFSTSFLSTSCSFANALFSLFFQCTSSFISERKIEGFTFALAIWV